MPDANGGMILACLSLCSDVTLQWETHFYFWAIFNQTSQERLLCLWFKGATNAYNVLASNKSICICATR